MICISENVKRFTKKVEFFSSKKINSDSLWNDWEIHSDHFCASNPIWLEPRITCGRDSRSADPTKRAHHPASFHEDRYGKVPRRATCDCW